MLRQVSAFRCRDIQAGRDGCSGMSHAACSTSHKAALQFQAFRVDSQGSAIGTTAICDAANILN